MDEFFDKRLPSLCVLCFRYERFGRNKGADPRLRPHYMEHFRRQRERMKHELAK